MEKRHPEKKPAPSPAKTEGQESGTGSNSIPIAADNPKLQVAEFVAEVQAIKGPQSTQPIQPAHAAALRLVINGAIGGNQAPGITALFLDLNRKPPKGGTTLFVGIGSVGFDVVVSNWQPRFQVDARNLAYQIETIRQDVEQVTVGRTYLTDGRVKVAGAVSGLTETIISPANWANPIPETSPVSGAWWVMADTGGRE